MIENDTKTRENTQKAPESHDLEVLVAEILKGARCSKVVKNGYTKPQAKAIITGLHEMILDYGGAIDALYSRLKMMIVEKEFYKNRLSQLNKEYFK